MTVFKCKMCGATLEAEEGKSVATCEYCGSVQTLPFSREDITVNLFNRATNIRLRNDFDKAAQVYEKILDSDDRDAEAHWGLVLCKYGIEYVEDPKTGVRVPTCHRTLTDSVMTDVDYLAAIENADPLRRKVYEDEAKKIAALQKEILEISANEEPFDVFICYKETDGDGKRTPDSVLANDIYYQLTREGLKVFFAAITLENRLGTEYEPYIYAALHSAKVMLVIGTRPEYFDAVWVKNEWSRYLSIMKNDRTRTLIPCYRDMDAYDLPEEFAHLQAQDMSKIGFISDLVRGIRKLTAHETSEKNEAAPTAASAAPAEAGTASLLRRVFIFLEDGDWKSANEYCEKVLDIDPECGEAYLGKLLAEMKVGNREELKNCEQPFDGNGNYRKIMKFGDDALKKELADINKRNEVAHLDGIYNNALSIMNSAGSEEACRNAANAFKSISYFKDADEMAAKCLEKAEICRKNTVYAHGKSKMNAASYEEAIALFRSISGWKDADEQIVICKKEIEKIGEAARIIADKAAKKRKKTAIIVAVVAVLAIVSAILINSFAPLNSVTEKGIIYNKRNGTYIVVGYTNDIGSTVVIPDKVRGVPVTDIGDSAFEDCTGLNSITIPDSVTDIGTYVFRNCTGLDSITIPDSVTSIGIGAFSTTAYYNNESNWVDGVLYVGNHLIKPKESVSGSYTIKAGTKCIADGAFGYCTGLTSITIPDGVTSIGEGAFINCYLLGRGLTSVTIGNGVTNIGDSAFESCCYLTSITFNGTMVQWKAISKGFDWNRNTGDYTVHCTDGDMSK